MKDNEIIKSNNEEKQIENHWIMPFQLFLRPWMMFWTKKLSVINGPFLNHVFLSFEYHKSKIIKANSFKFLENLQKTKPKRCSKARGRGMYLINATPIWKSFQYFARTLYSKILNMVSAIRFMKYFELSGISYKPSRAI